MQRGIFVNATIGHGALLKVCLSLGHAITKPFKVRAEGSENNR